MKLESNIFIKRHKMKPIIFLLFFTYNLCLLAQNESMVGHYEMKFEASNGLIIYKLTLNPDRTFKFHSYRFLEDALTKEENLYAKGTWNSDNKLIFFSTDSDDFDEIHTLDFNNTKARFISKSPRNITNKDIKSSILIYHSEIFWLTKNNFLKIN